MKRTKILIVMIMGILLLILTSKSSKAINVSGSYYDKTISGVIREDYPDLKNSENKKVIGVSPNTSFTANFYSRLRIRDIKAIPEDSQVFSSTGMRKGPKDRVATGDRVEVLDTETGVVTSYDIVLFGDVNGDGAICDVSDFREMSFDIIRKRTLTGVYRIAANVWNSQAEDFRKSEIDVKDLNRMMCKVLGGQNKHPLVGYSLIRDYSIFADEDESKPEILPEDELLPTGSYTINIGESITLNSDRDVTWSTDNPRAATVTKNGVVTGYDRGTAVITATDKETGKTSTINIKVINAIVQIVKDDGSVDDKFETLAEATIAAKGGKSTITLLRDADLNTHDNPNNSAATVDTTQNIVLDLNGHNAMIVDDDSIVVNGTFTIKDSVGEGSIQIEEGTLMNASATSKVIIESGRIGNEGTAVLQSRGEVEINGGTIDGSNSFSMKGDVSKITVNGGNINGKVWAISSDTGKVIINDGTITSTNIDSATTTTIKAGGGTIEVNGGTVKSSENALATIYMKGDSGNITINGGKVISFAGTDSAIYQDCLTGNIFVYGGEISGASNVIRQYRGKSIKVSKTGTQPIRITQNGTSAPESTAAIRKEDRGNIYIGTSSDGNMYNDQMTIQYTKCGIVAQDAEVEIYNGYLHGSEENSIGAVANAKAITITPAVSSFHTSATIETVHNSTNKCVLEDIIFTND